MALVKCPRCELNYMQSTDKYCTVCRRELFGKDEQDSIEICTNCGERPAMPGEDLCTICLKEITRTEGFGTSGDADGELVDETALELPASEMDEIEIEIEEESIPDGEYKVIKHELGDDEEEDPDFATVSLDEIEKDEDDEEEEE